MRMVLEEEAIKGKVVAKSVQKILDQEML